MRIREGKFSDAKAIARVHVDCWRTTYSGIIKDEYLNRLSYEQRTELWERNISRDDNHVFVAENPEGKIIGFVDGGRERSGNYPGYDGDITSIYILSEYQGQGVGKQLLQVLFQRFISLQMNTALVWVLADNSSKTFYENMGARLIVDNKSITIGGDDLVLLAYGWDDIQLIAE
ncbi:GNAT family N-acetyltransferase [Ornithinibacillus xuwenensis]|uniref:GNAT family N-acetyltransferase n=1 Tax=Ornithinibacillus xuwenensis TaxID=3144668 RepID=A0ABU9XJ40_9BACI